MYKDKERQKLNGVYRWAKARCRNPNVAQYKDWGGRGIKFLFNSFEEFLTVLGPRPPGYSLDRINNDGHYEPGNVRWASRKEQNSNKGQYSNSTTGITGIHRINPNKLHSEPYFCARVYIDGKRKEIYKGPSLEKATKLLQDYNEKNS